MLEQAVTACACRLSASPALARVLCVALMAAVPSRSLPGAGLDDPYGSFQLRLFYDALFRQLLIFLVFGPTPLKPISV